MCAFQRREYFVDAGCVALVRDQLLRTAGENMAEVIAYCFMPDHLHVLVEGRAPRSDLIVCATAFRQRSGYSYKRLCGTRLWQEGYFDRVLRDEENTIDVVRNMLANPMRAGLCADPRLYPFSGSGRYAIRDLLMWLG
jgi:REP-associated tyrosine transposase